MDNLNVCANLSMHKSNVSAIHTTDKYQMCKKNFFIKVYIHHQSSHIASMHLCMHTHTHTNSKNGTKLRHRNNICSLRQTEEVHVQSHLN